MPDIFDLFTIPLRDWINVFIDWLVANFRPFFRAAREPIGYVLDGVEAILQNTPPLLFLILLFLLAMWIAGWRVGLFSVIGMAFLGFVGIWTDTMTTLSLVITAVFFCAITGIPLGILAARSKTIWTVMRPVLDTMQTTPSFVYLVPIAILFGIGNVAGIIATIIFALPPIIRLTNLGIRNVPEDMVEAAYAFGSTPAQVLLEVQLPLALRTILAGLNQTLMLALSMVVIASLISAGGLGTMVLRGISRLDMGLATVGGVGIVLLAIVLDRITQALGPAGQQSPGAAHKTA
jgi:glycine betaine/proline transport system permease protein